MAATDVGDARHMVAERNKPFITGYDSAALSASLKALIADGELRHRLGRDNRERAQAEYGLEKMLASWHALYEDE